MVAKTVDRVCKLSVYTSRKRYKTHIHIRCPPEGIYTHHLSRFCSYMILLLKMYRLSKSLDGLQGFKLSSLKEEKCLRSKSYDTLEFFNMNEALKKHRLRVDDT